LHLSSAEYQAVLLLVLQYGEKGVPHDNFTRRTHNVRLHQDGETQRSGYSMFTYKSIKDFHAVRGCMHVLAVAIGKTIYPPPHARREHRHGGGSGAWELHGFAADQEVVTAEHYKISSAQRIFSKGCAAFYTLHTTAARMRLDWCFS
jgi:hypothetical protein